MCSEKRCYDCLSESVDLGSHLVDEDIPAPAVMPDKFDEFASLGPAHLQQILSYEF